MANDQVNQNENFASAIAIFPNMAKSHQLQDSKLVAASLRRSNILLVLKELYQWQGFLAELQSVNEHRAIPIDLHLSYLLVAIAEATTNRS